MIFRELSLGAVLLLATTSMLLLISKNWRLSIASFALQYLGVFWLTSLLWPIGLSAIKLIIGWMAAALIGAAQMDNHLNSVKSSRDSGFFVRLAAGGLIWLFIIAIEPRMEAWLPAPDIVIYGALILIGMGLLHIGMSKLPFGILAGLLTIISGFEILYASIESSVLIAGLMAMINLGLALSGVYLTAQQEERTE